MSDYIIKRVEAMAYWEIQDKTITFSDRSGNVSTNVYDSPVGDTDVAAVRVFDPRN
jgi:hypothetical protein